MNLANAKIAQLLVPVDDLGKAVSFYRDVLGPFGNPLALMAEVQVGGL